MSHLQTPFIPLRACKKPCHDCPFRADHPPYQTREDMVNNLAWTFDPECVAICHHSTKFPPDKHVACAGALLFAQSVGESKPIPAPAGNVIPIYCLEAFALAWESDAKMRYDNWLSLQPNSNP